MILSTGSIQAYRDRESLQAGMYIIRFEDEQEYAQTVKIIKQ